jgi:hypothetical protein
MHLLKKRHILSMTKVALRTKQQVLKMRAIQRSQQNEQETNPGNTEQLTSFTKFCAICKLNYRQSKSEHTNSKSHEVCFIFDYGLNDSVFPKIFKLHFHPVQGNIYKNSIKINRNQLAT